MKKLILHKLHQFKNWCDNRESPFPVIHFFYKWFNKPIKKINEIFLLSYCHKISLFSLYPKLQDECPQAILHEDKGQSRISQMKHDTAHNQLQLALQWHWGSYSSYYPGQRNFKFKWHWNVLTQYSVDRQVPFEDLKTIKQKGWN